MIRSRLLHPALLLASCTIVAATAAAAQRQPAAGRTLVFSRSQLKYGFDRNYMRRWLDRPLLIDPATREDGVRSSLSILWRIGGDRGLHPAL